MGVDKKKLHRRKMVAPIFVSAIMVLYYIAYFAVIIKFIDGILAILLGIIPLALCGTIIYVCIQRIKEIRNGEEDDLSQY